MSYITASDIIDEVGFFSKDLNLSKDLKDTKLFKDVVKKEVIKTFNKDFEKYTDGENKEWYLQKPSITEKISTTEPKENTKTLTNLYRKFMNKTGHRTIGQKQFEQEKIKFDEDAEKNKDLEYYNNEYTIARDMLRTLTEEIFLSKIKEEGKEMKKVDLENLTPDKKVYFSIHYGTYINYLGNFIKHFTKNTEIESNIEDNTMGQSAYHEIVNRGTLRQEIMRFKNGVMLKGGNTEEFNSDGSLRQRYGHLLDLPNLNTHTIYEFDEHAIQEPSSEPSSEATGGKRRTRKAKKSKKQRKTKGGKKTAKKGKKSHKKKSTRRRRRH